MAQVWMALAWKSTVVLSGAWLLAALMRKQPAWTRHMVWSAALAAVLLIPALSVSLPQWRVALPAPAFRLEAAALGTAAQEAGPVARTGAATLPAPEPGGADWSRLSLLIWALGAAAILLGIARAWVNVMRARAAASPFEAPEQEELLRRLGIGRTVRVLESRQGTMPMTAGVLRPVVFLPADARGWTRERRRMVLLHELAHVRRGDAAAQLMARCAVALCWWNPLVWKAWREFLKERERAADDLVLMSGARASEYAGHLLAIARSLAAAPVAAAVPMVRPSQLEDRLTAILDAGVRRGAAGRAGIAVAAVTAVALTIPLAALRAQEHQPGQADVEATIQAARSQRNFEILDRAAEAAVSGLRYDAAKKLLDAGLAVRRDQNGEGSVEYGEGLLRLARLEVLRGNRQAADELFALAAGTLKAHPRAASAWIWLGTSALVNKDHAKALELFERARGVDSSGPRPLMWMAVARQHEGNAAEAEALYKNAMALAGGNTAEMVTLLMVYSNFLKSQGRDQEAMELAARARQTQKATAMKVSAATAGIKRIGGGVSAPNLVEKLEPKYSEEARAAKLTGTVVLYAEVWADGRAHNVQVIEGLGLGLDEKAVEAVSQWRFSPGMQNGQPVNVSATIEVNFKLL